MSERKPSSFWSPWIYALTVIAVILIGGTDPRSGGCAHPHEPKEYSSSGKTEEKCFSSFDGLLFFWIDARIDTISTAVSAAATVTIALFTLFLIRVGRQQATHLNSTIKQMCISEERQLRAYVYLEVTSRHYPLTPKVWDRHSVTLYVKNAGETWGRNLRVRRAILQNPEEAIHFFEKCRETDSGPAQIIAPGQEIPLQFADILRSDHVNLTNGSLKIFLAAWITYEDAFDKPRQTQLFCQLNGDIEENTSFSYMPTHNCADDDCPI